MFTIWSFVISKFGLAERRFEVALLLDITNSLKRYIGSPLIVRTSIDPVGFMQDKTVEVQ
jgi:hypothetical protein